MKRVYIVAEGQTEQEFINSLISPYLRNFGILSVTPILIRTSRTGRGGMVNYQHLYNTVKMLLGSSQADFIVTTFIDFYRLPANMPQYAQSMSLPNKISQVETLETAIDQSISDRRFFSYIQLSIISLNSLQRKQHRLFQLTIILKISTHRPKGHLLKDCWL